MLVDAETLEPAGTASRGCSARRPSGSSPSCSSRSSISRRPPSRRRKRPRPSCAASERGGRAGGGARPRRARDGLAPDGAWARSLVPVERYRRLKAKLGPRLYRQQVCGLHVHAPCPIPDTCLRAFEGVVPRLPGLPPRLRTRRTGTARRAAGARSAPRSCSRCRPAGLPRCCGAGTTGRPRPAATASAALGCLAAARVRDARGAGDGPADSLRRTAELAAEVQRLVREAAESAVSRSTGTSTRAARRAGREAAGRRPSASSSSGRRLRSGDRALTLG